MASDTVAPSLAQSLLGDPHAAPPTALLGRSSAPSSRYVRVVKPLLDIVGAAIMLVALAPVMLAVGLAVYLSLGGPVLFSQVRVGKDGRRFRAWKFRSMQADRRRTSGNHDGPERRIAHKRADDPRLTPTGRLLRRLSLDELPQLVNVLKGDMSLVGPRPELPEIIERHYRPWQHRRHAIKPGLTGLWQVSERGNGMMHEHIDVDLDYIDQVGPSLDLRILLRTIPAALHTHQGH